MQFFACFQSCYYCACILGFLSDEDMSSLQIIVRLQDESVF